MTLTNQLLGGRFDVNWLPLRCFASPTINGKHFCFGSCLRALHVVNGLSNCLVMGLRLTIMHEIRNAARREGFLG